MWCGLVVAIFYFWPIFFAGRGLQKWEESQKKRWNQWKRGELVDPSPPYYIDGQGRVHTDVVGLFSSPAVQEVYDRAEEIVRLQHERDGTTPPVHG